MLTKRGELETDGSDSEATQDSELTSQVRREKDETDSENNMVLLSYLIRRSQLEKYLETSISSDAFYDLDMKSL